MAEAVSEHDDEYHDRLRGQPEPSSQDKAVERPRFSEETDVQRDKIGTWDSLQEKELGIEKQAEQDLEREIAELAERQRSRLREAEPPRDSLSPGSKSI
jgi:hypothetical protein